jgi:predicted component of type VI protein secretion system
MWLLTWGPRHIHTIFPKGLPAGLTHKDYGDTVPLQDAAGNSYPGYQDWIQWDIGVAVHDWRFGVRAANIDVALFGGGSAANLIEILAAMVYKPPIMPAGVAPVQTSDSPDKLMMGRSAIYVNRTVYLALDLQAQNKTNLLLKMDEWDGHVVLTYRGVPIRVVDALLTSETRVT